MLSWTKVWCRGNPVFFCGPAVPWSMLLPPLFVRTGQRHRVGLGYYKYQESCSTMQVLVIVCSDDMQYLGTSIVEQLFRYSSCLRSARCQRTVLTARGWHGPHTVQADHNKRWVASTPHFLPRRRTILLIEAFIIEQRFSRCSFFFFFPQDKQEKQEAFLKFGNSTEGKKWCSYRGMMYLVCQERLYFIALQSLEKNEEGKSGRKKKRETRIWKNEASITTAVL